MVDQFKPLVPGERVRTSSGRLGTVYSVGKRAAADIRRATTERERDMHPYTVNVEGIGFVSYRGHELDRSVS